VTLEDELRALRAEVLDLRDREQIAACLVRYCRGLDRRDRELLLSTFHPDATICNSWLTTDPVEFAAHYFARASGRDVCSHHLTNMTIEIDGDTAHVEAYWLLPKALPGEDLNVLGGRYVVRLERRAGEWRVAVQFNISEWQLVADGTAIEHVRSRRNAPSAADGSDLSYARPLQPLPPSADPDWAATIAR
jgi:hypothetical protein